MSSSRFDFGGKVALVTGVGRVGQIGNAVALAFGQAGAKIVACDLNAVGVATRVREFAAQGVDVDLVGVMNTVAVTLPSLPDGASIVITGSTAGLMPDTTDNPVLGPGGAGYGFAKKMLVPYVEALALQLASRFIRVNAVHPTNTNTHLLHHDDLYKVFRPDLTAPTREDAEPAFVFFQAMPIPYVEPEDIANLVLFLASDESRYITGHQIRVDAGSLLKIPGSAR